MPIRRKINRQKSGVYMVCLPKSWVHVAEQKMGKRATGVNIEVNNKLTIELVFENYSPEPSLGDKGSRPELA